MQPQPYAPVNAYPQYQTAPYPQQGYVDNPGITTTTYPMQDPYQQQQQPYSGLVNQQPQAFVNPQPQVFVAPQQQVFVNPQPQVFTVPQQQGFVQYNNTTYINQPQVITNNDDLAYAPQQPSQSPNKEYEKLEKLEKPRERPKAPPKYGSRLSRTWTYLGDVQNPGRGYNLLALFSIVAVLGILIGLMAYHFGDKDLKLTSVSGGLQNIVNNLNSDPILDLTTAGSAPYCPSGTEAIRLGTWDGTGKGCNCPVTGLSTGSCDNSDSFCDDINAINAIDMFIWEGSVVCAKRAQLNVDYVKKADCPAGFQNRCSVGICMEDSTNCPVTSLSITTGGINPNLKFSATSKYLTYSRVTGDSPVVQLEVSMNNVPCFSKTEIPSGAGKYSLLNNAPSGCEKYGADTTYSSEIDRLKNDVVFRANYFPQSVFNLPGYQSVLQATDMILSRRKRIDVANIDACLSLDTDMIMEASKASENMNNYMTGTAITAMVLHGCVFLFAVITLLSMRSNHSWKEIFFGREAKQWMPFYLYFGAADIVTFIVMVGLVRSAQTKMTKARSYLVELDEMGCFPSGAPQQVVADYDDLVDSVAANLFGLSLALLVVSLVSYVPVAVKLFSKWREAKRKNRTFAY